MLVVWDAMTPVDYLRMVILINYCLSICSSARKGVIYVPHHLSSGRWFFRTVRSVMSKRDLVKFNCCEPRIDHPLFNSSRLAWKMADILQTAFTCILSKTFSCFECSLFSLLLRGANWQYCDIDSGNGLVLWYQLQLIKSRFCHPRNWASLPMLDRYRWWKYKIKKYTYHQSNSPGYGLTHCGQVTTYGINIGSGNDLLPGGTKPSPEPNVDWSSVRPRDIHLMTFSEGDPKFPISKAQIER